MALLTVNDTAIASTTPMGVEDMIRSYDWDYETAYAVMLCESGGDNKAVNDNPATMDRSIGLYQINLFGENALTRPSEEWLKNPANNIAYAYYLYQDSGWRHWERCYNKVR